VRHSIYSFSDPKVSEVKLFGDGPDLLRVGHPRPGPGLHFERLMETPVDGAVRIALDSLPPPRSGLRPEEIDPVQDRFGVVSP
jgi:hypothetical protein